MIKIKVKAEMISFYKRDIPVMIGEIDSRPK